MNRADITAELIKLPPHSRGRRPMEQILRRMTIEEMKWDRLEQCLIAELNAAFDAEFPPVNANAH